MMLDLRRITIELSKWNEGKAIVLRGKGNMFCAGSDLAAVQFLVSPKEGGNVCMYMQNTLYAFQCLPMVSLAYIEGKAMGGGAELVTACDLRLMHESAEIRFVQRRLGLIPGWGGTTRLKRLIGRQRAMRLLMSGLGVRGEEALRMGLVDGVGCEPHVWLDTVVGGLDSYVIKTIKSAVNQTDFKTDQQSLQREIELIYKVWGGPANRQAIDAIKPTITVGGTPYVLELIDTAGQEDYDRLRPLSYNKADVFLVCYSVVVPSSFTNIKETWIPELKQHSTKVGTQTDLRDDPRVLQELHKKKQKPVNVESGQRRAAKLGAAAYKECSAVTMNGIKDVFDEAIHTVLYPEEKSSEKKNCTIS
uniref:TC10 protein isoform X2 n=1 Tax=Ciona intestinalis TaxID=7719 RepID=UPI000EF4B9C9|nr:TC10 protein isoform X2 [Ciona intestinalis]|eukprot:XP_026694094.1 TC10 protein isoform X2 [Ciona intestinalis]